VRGPKRRARSRGSALKRPRARHFTGHRGGGKDARLVENLGLVAGWAAANKLPAPARKSLRLIAIIRPKTKKAALGSAAFLIDPV